ncbi:hypothetical protein [Spirochaeta lutea]|uniref:Uncharacterized protein n=1 Tax=Spirochaeta lutea TaxID=1480694 RepID=A0A098R1N4_9SPIO|nr:hypothetical protein [Spirochaeta lutea]KGE73588.1 hypothetical protein DC28_02760 [Spirochaeta lutea]
MRRSCIHALAYIVLCSGAVFGGIPQELNRVTVANETGMAIRHLYSSPADSDLWGPDLITGLDTLDYGEMRSFFVHYSSACARFSFLAEDISGGMYLVEDVQICNGDESLVMVSQADGVDDRGALWAGASVVRVVLTNSVIRELWYLFFSPRESKMWGVDILDDISTLPVGASRVYYLLVPEAGGEYDILGFDEVDRAVVKRVEITPDQETVYLELSEDDIH